MATDLVTAPVRSAEIFVFRAPIEKAVRTSFGIMHDRPAVLLRLEDEDGMHGWGEAWCNFPSCGAEHRARLLETAILPKVIGKPVEHGAIGASPRVSGSMKSHYAPEHVLKIVSADDLPGETQFLARHFKTFSLIAPEKIAKRFCTVAEKVRGYKDAKELQVNLYKWLHELDHDGGDVIFAVEPELTDSSAGVLDRLTRAAAERPNKESK